MTDQRIAPALSEALSAKGYESLTPVQEAMLGEELAGRDLLVSAQTGSGKTVAFGIAMAAEMLNGAEMLPPPAEPLALAIAPTRELALQVARELAWLYGKAGVQIATCVGGMDYRNERRSLERGAHIVVGTPGRLRDHIERRSLDLSWIQTVVLDEADEMLDLGFAEDLEFILKAAPETRRTLMFSATVPAGIEKLAATFQRDALRIQTAGEARQHGDIEYQAVSVSARDREHAIFNILRFHEAQTAIIFCKTRMNVNHLLARMGNRGFQVVALSGELSQSERMHALQSLRDGRARVCIATDVAARGIDLPGLELVIHADLPSNSETLLHRSGRTGRAGRKGTSVLIVPPSEFRKANRLLQGAKVVAEWGKAPSADEVQAREDARLLDSPLLADGPGDDLALAEQLAERFDAQHLAAAFVRLWREGRSAPEVLQDDLPPAPAPSAPRDRNAFGPADWFLLNVGHEGRAEARWLLPKICDAFGMTKSDIGAIRVQQTVTFVQIAKDPAARITQRTELEPGLTIEPVEGEPQLARPERAERSERPARATKPRAEKSWGDKPFADKPKYDKPRGDKPAYTPKPARFVEDEGEAPAPRKPYARREEGDAPRKPYAKREDGDDKRSYKPRAASEDAPRKPWAKREDGDAPRKPYAKRDEGDRPRKAYDPLGEDRPRKPYVKREDGDAPRKPWAKREDGDAPRKPYAKRDEGDAPRKPYAPRSDEGAAKPRWKSADRTERPSAPKSAGFKSHGGGKDKPARSTGFKSHGGEDKPFGKPASRAKPAPRPVDARDTSKRFVPPKKK